MIRNYKKFIYIIFFIFGFISIYFVLTNEKNTKIAKYKEENFNFLVKKSKNYLQALIKEKQNATLAIAISLAQDPELIKAVEKRKLSNKRLKEL